MTEKESKAKYYLGALGCGIVTLNYGIYMLFGPGGDGAIFGTVAGVIGAIIGGVAGFEFGLKKSQ